MVNLLMMDLEESLLIQMGILLQFLHLTTMEMEMTQVMQEFILGMGLLGLKEVLILMVRQQGTYQGRVLLSMMQVMLLLLAHQIIQEQMEPLQVMQGFGLGMDLLGLKKDLTWMVKLQQMDLVIVLQ